MYCVNCGTELPHGANACPECGMMVGVGPVARAAQVAHAAGAAGVAAAAEAVRSATGAGAAGVVRHDSYEYARTTVKSDLATVATDCYESLGFELTGAKDSQAGGTTVLAFRRSRKVRGKAQLAKLQRTADDLIARLASLEDEKTRRPTMIALATGILSALVFGIGMCCTMVWTQFMVLGIVVGLVGIAGCVGTWLLYRANVRKETARVAPQIEAAYDQLATVCEEAQSVLAVA